MNKLVNYALKLLMFLDLDGIIKIALIELNVFLSIDSISESSWNPIIWIEKQSNTHFLWYVMCNGIEKLVIDVSANASLLITSSCEFAGISTILRSMQSPN